MEIFELKYFLAVAQVENVLIAIYNVETRPGLYVTNRLYFTHQRAVEQWDLTGLQKK